MVFDGVQLTRPRSTRKRRSQVLAHSDPLAPVANAVDDQRKVRSSGQCERDLLYKIGLRILIDRDVMDLGELDTPSLQTIPDRLRRKARPVLDPPEALLLRSRDQRSVTDQASRGIAMKCIDPENVQGAGEERFERMRYLPVSRPSFRS